MRRSLNRWSSGSDTSGRGGRAGVGCFVRRTVVVTTVVAGGADAAEVDGGADVDGVREWEPSFRIT